MQSIEFEVVEEIEKLVNVCAVGVIVIVIVAFFIWSLGVCEGEKDTA